MKAKLDRFSGFIAKRSFFTLYLLPFFLFFVINFGIVQLKGFGSAFWADTGNVINYLFLVPLIFISFKVFYNSISKTLIYPLSEKLISDNIQRRKYLTWVRNTCNPNWVIRYYFFILAFVTQIIINIRMIVNDANPKSIWLKSLPFDIFIIFNWVYYIIINAILLYFIIDVAYRCIRFIIIFWKLYILKSFGDLKIDFRYFSPSTNNPVYTLGGFSFSSGFVFLFVAFNYLTFQYFFLQNSPGFTSSSSKLLQEIALSSGWILALPILFFIFPLIPVIKCHSSTLNIYKNEKYLELKHNAVISNSSLVPLLNHINDFSLLEKAIIIPIRLKLLKVFTLLIPFIIEIILNNWIFK